MVLSPFFYILLPLLCLLYLPQSTFQITWTPAFLGLNPEAGLWQESGFGQDVIIGFVDSGIWPESPCFADQGLTPIGARWKGACESGASFNQSHCNNKVIGARFFRGGVEASTNNSDIGNEYLSPRDKFGHGTFVASIAACNPVRGANMFGACNGTARGLAPKARIATYKACWDDYIGECGDDKDILAAIDKAIEDGVDVLSVSVTGDRSENYLDPVSIGSYAAIQKGVIVVAAAGNFGADPYSVVNTAPWLITVGASTTGRTFPVRVELANGKSFIGSSYYVGTSSIDGLLVEDECTSVPEQNTLLNKIFVCSSTIDMNIAVQFADAGAIGIIEINDEWDGEEISNKGFPLPGVTIGYEGGLEILSYINKTRTPTAVLKFRKDMVVDGTRAPMVARFSSRGPSLSIPEVLKPDILAPGHEILAALPLNNSPTTRDDPRRSAFTIKSGTAAATPHIAGIAALLRAAHPSWSPAAIKSALMTTARVVDNQFRPVLDQVNMSQASPLDFGAGLVDPEAANDPGLVYDADANDYIKLLCSSNYTQQQVQQIVRGNSSISCTNYAGGPGDFNYPSFSVMFNSSEQIKRHTRTLTNVAELRYNETYDVRVLNLARNEVGITVNPTQLNFTETNQKLSFTVEFASKQSPKELAEIDYEETVESSRFAYIMWVSMNHVVRSPVVMMWRNGKTQP